MAPCPSKLLLAAAAALAQLRHGAEGALMLRGAANATAADEPQDPVAMAMASLKELKETGSPNDEDQYVEGVDDVDDDLSSDKDAKDETDQMDEDDDDTPAPNGAAQQDGQDGAPMLPKDAFLQTQAGGEQDPSRQDPMAMARASLKSMQDTGAVDRGDYSEPTAYAGDRDGDAMDETDKEDEGEDESPPAAQNDVPGMLEAPQDDGEGESLVQTGSRDVDDADDDDLGMDEDAVEGGEEADDEQIDDDGESFLQTGRRDAEVDDEQMDDDDSEPSAEDGGDMAEAGFEDDEDEDADDALEQYQGV